MYKFNDEFSVKFNVYCRTLSVLYTIRHVETICPSEISHIPGEELNISYLSVGNDVIGGTL